MADGHYATCAQVLSVCQSYDLEAILQPEAGYAPRMRQICEEQIEQLEDRLGSGTAQAEIDILRLEQNTWGLLQAILSERKTEQPPTSSPQDLLLANPYTPPYTLTDAIIHACPLLKELIVVREWLQETAPIPTPPEASTGYWNFTKHTIKQGVRTGHAPREGIVAEMDPDAVNRVDGAALAADDASYEKSLVQALCGYIRAGREDEALDLCRRANQPWRAASIRGSKNFQWDTLATVNDEELDNEGEPIWSGNRNRALWKATCVRAALSPKLSDQERILYVSLCPTPQTFSILKASCRTWEDHLWADIHLICEDKVTNDLAKLAAGSFWIGGVEATDKGPGGLLNLALGDDQEWEQEVIKTLESLKGVAVLEGAPANDPFHFCQLFIILNRTDNLLNVFADSLLKGDYSNNQFEYNAMCRFFAHFCLFLKMIDMPVPPHATQVILESYIAVLEAADQRDLIALYAGALGDNAIARYAAFLVSLGLGVDLAARRAALTRAREHGLDPTRVAVAAAERTIQAAFADLGTRGRGPLPSLVDHEALAPPSDSELLLLRSVEWTVLDEATHTFALEQATVILRSLLGRGRVHVAQTLLDVLPAELAVIGEPEEVATEYLHYRQFFVIWETLARIVEWQAEESAVEGSRDARSSWVVEYRALVDQVYDQIKKLLTTEWLVTEVDNEGGDLRRRELIRIRQIFVPELVLRLHHLLVTSRSVIPENLRRALDLVNTVADARYKLYLDFPGAEAGRGGRPLATYVGAVRQAMLAGLERGGTDPFRIVASG